MLGEVLRKKVGEIKVNSAQEKEVLKVTHPQRLQCELLEFLVLLDSTEIVASAREKPQPTKILVKDCLNANFVQTVPVTEAWRCLSTSLFRQIHVLTDHSPVTLDECEHWYHTTLQHLEEKMVDIPELPGVAKGQALQYRGEQTLVLGNLGGERMLT